MRVAGQIKGGFYPVPTEALDMLASSVTTCEGASLLDPCCGEGAALAKLGEMLEIPASKCWAVELERKRAEKAREVFADNLLGPADFLRCDIKPGRCFSMIWCNPPYDWELGGGGRVEFGFVQRCTPALADGGILAKACPESVMGNHAVQTHLLAWYDDIWLRPFPAGHRKYNEMIVLGRKRPRALGVNRDDWLKRVRFGGRQEAAYQLPPAAGPRSVAKAGLTDGEALLAIRQSPLSKLFTTGSRPAPAPSPPLELTKGQMALVLAGGFLNTSVRLPGQEPVLIKASPFKEMLVTDEREEIKGAGTDAEEVVTVRVSSEQIRLKVRVMDADGKIHDLV